MNKNTIITSKNTTKLTPTTSIHYQSSSPLENEEEVSHSLPYSKGYCLLEISY